MSDSLTDRVLTAFNELVDDLSVHECDIVDEVRAMESQLADYKYTPQAYDEMWARVKEVVNENDILKAENAELRKEVQKQETLKNWARVDAEEESRERDELKAENTTLRQAIQNTLDTGMDRYIKEIDKRMTK